MSFIATCLVIYLLCFPVQSNFRRSRVNLLVAEGTTIINAKSTPPEVVPSEHHLVWIPLVPFSATRRGRRRQLIQSANISNNQPLDYSYSLSQLYRGYGTHYVDLWVGSTIPQRQTVIVDTGSSITAFPCQSCKECGYGDLDQHRQKRNYHIDPYFVPSNSTTFHKLNCKECKIGKCEKRGVDKIKEETHKGTCQLSLRYLEGSSWQGYEAVDLIYTGGSHQMQPQQNNVYNSRTYASNFQTKIHFACQTSMTGLFQTQLADGIMGMTKHRNSFWHQMYNSGIINSKKFSLCFVNERHVSRDGSAAGIMTLGGSDSTLHSTPMVYAQEITQGTKDVNYHVYIEKIFLQNNQDQGHPILQEVKINEYEMNFKLRGAMIDSGTTVTYFSKVMKKPFQKSWRDMMGFDYGGSIPKSMKIEQLPTIVLQLRGTSGYNSSVMVHIPPANYVSEGSDRRVLEPQVHLGSGKTVTLGANFLSGYDVLFDIDNQRIGFAQSDCQMPKIPMTSAINSSLADESTHSVNNSNPFQTNNTFNNKSDAQQPAEIAYSATSNPITASNSTDLAINDVSGKEIQISANRTDSGSIKDKSPSHPKEKQHYNATSLVLSDGINNGNDTINENNITTASSADASTLHSSQVSRSPTSFLLLLYIILVLGSVLLALLWQESPRVSENGFVGKNIASNAQETHPLIETAMDPRIEEDSEENGPV